MNKEWKEKWIEALRSGKYVQGRGQPRREDDKFCCLGVFCDIYDSSKWLYEGYMTGYTYGDFNDFMFIPKDIREKIGIAVSKHHTLVSMNDYGATFEQIANYIEEEL